MEKRRGRARGSHLEGQVVGSSDREVILAGVLLRRFRYGLRGERPAGNSRCRSGRVSGSLTHQEDIRDSVLTAAPREMLGQLLRGFVGITNPRRRIQILAAR